MIIDGALAIIGELGGPANISGASPVMIGPRGGTHEPFASGNRETMKDICGANSWRNLMLN
jgi:hypothetical protein